MYVKSYGITSQCIYETQYKTSARLVAHLSASSAQTYRNITVVTCCYDHQQWKSVLLKQRIAVILVSSVCLMFNFT